MSRDNEREKGLAKSFEKPKTQTGDAAGRESEAGARSLDDAGHESEAGARALDAVPGISEARLADGAQMEAQRQANPDQNQGTLQSDKSKDSVKIVLDGPDGKKITLASRHKGGSEKDIARGAAPGESITIEELTKRKAGGDVFAAKFLQQFEGATTDEERRNIQLAADRMYGRAAPVVLKALEPKLDTSLEEAPFKGFVRADVEISETQQSEVTAGAITEGGSSADSRYLLKGYVTSDATIDDSTQPGNDFQSVMERVSKLPFDQQMRIIGMGLQTFTSEMQRQQFEATLGTTIGVVEGVGNLLQDSVAMTDGLAQIIVFAGDVMTNNPRALETADKAGESIGRSIVNGVRIFTMAENYVADVTGRNDYEKPFQDIAALAEEMDRRWQALPTRERARMAARMSTDILSNFTPPGAANKIARAEKITEAIEEIGAIAHTADAATKNHLARGISEAVKDLARPAILAAGEVEDVAGGVESALRIERKRLSRVGAGGDWPTINERPSPDVVQQIHPGSCVSAVGEMLSKGTIDQQTLIDALGLWADPDELPGVLGPGWKAGTVNIKGVDNPEVTLKVLMRQAPFGVELRDPMVHKVDAGHEVVVDGFSDLLDVVIRDPKHGTTYDMTVDNFLTHWTERAVFFVPEIVPVVLPEGD